MSKKNSSVNLNNDLKEFKNLSNIFNNFKDKLDSLNKKSYVVAVSGGPDSLALAALSKAYSYHKKSNFHFVLVNHNIKSNSTSCEMKYIKSCLVKAFYY